MIQSNRKWLLTASPWMRNSFTMAKSGIFVALLMLCSGISNAQLHSVHQPVGVSVSGFQTMTHLTADLASAITGQTTICMSAPTTNLSNATSGGTWTSSATSVATVGSATGIVTAVAPGVTIITYTVGTQYTTKNVWVTYPIQGTFSVCVGSQTALVDSTPSGLWTSSNTTNATINAAGLMTAIDTGVTTITYGQSGACSVTQVVTVNANTIAPITGNNTICTGQTSTLADITTGGTWSSSATGIATVSTGGVVTAVSSGATTITYTVGTCYVTRSFVVNSTAPAAISGASSVCTNNTYTLTDATPLGSWSSSNTAIATVNAGGAVTGVTAGNATITYTKLGCSAVLPITVNANTLTAITGGNYVCVAGTDSLFNTTTGGVWSSNNAALATVDATYGVVTGVAAGTPTIIYTAGGCYISRTVNVNATVPAAISGSASVCVGTNTALTDALIGGTWSSSNTAIATVAAAGYAGNVTGVSAGSVNITYTSLGCSAVLPMTVNAAPAAIGGASSVCSGATTTLTNSVTGGTWSSSNAAMATVSTGGVVTGTATLTGTVVITYNAGGCNATKVLTVTALPAITGPTTACLGYPTIPVEYSIAIALSGGVWSVTNASASINAGNGTLTPAAAGIDTVKYTRYGCTTILPVTIGAAVAPITGSLFACGVGGTTALADTSTVSGTGGTWSSSNTSVATVSTGGVVTAVALGNTYITYTLSNGCTRATNVNVNPTPNAISGPTSVCVSGVSGSYITLTTTTSGGSWSTSNTDVTVSATGAGVANIYGITAGVSTISYTVAGCAATYNVTGYTNFVGSVSGVPAVCVGSVTTLACSPSGGNWSTSDATLATVTGSSTGLNGYVAGVAAGTLVVTYTNGGCFKTYVFTVHPSPATIGGAYSVCTAGTTTLTNTVTGGTWSSGNTTFATISAGGVVSGIAAGTTTITYSVPGGCSAYQPMAVNQTPATIGGASAVCTGIATSVTEATTGGVWSSNNNSLATIDASGNLTYVAAGTDTVSYTMTYAGGQTCAVGKAIIANGTATPAITGSNIVCFGDTATTLFCAVSGGSWTSSNTLVVSNPGGTNKPTYNAGLLTGVSVGTATVTYTKNGCYSTAVVTVNANTMAAIAGGNNVCLTAADSLIFTDATTGGNWSVTPSTVATIGATTGILKGVSQGGAIVTYYSTVQGGCRVLQSINVKNAVSPITGSNQVCIGTAISPYYEITLSNADYGGTWTSSTPAKATINPSGGVLGVAAGTTTISYSLVGCYTPATLVVTVNPQPAAIGGPNPKSICGLGNSITLTEATTGGAWSSNNTGIGTVAGGVVTDVATGTVTISYTLPTGCFVTASVTNSVQPDAITGPGTVCVGQIITLTDDTVGGSWSHFTPSFRKDSIIAGDLSNQALVTGYAAGIDTIYYTTSGCPAAKYVITVNPAIGAITGSSSVCKTLTTTLADTTQAGTGGAWTSSDATLATISTGGVVTGVAVGSPVMTFTSTSGCIATMPMYVAGCGFRSVEETNAINSLDNQHYSLFPNPSNGEITIMQSIEDNSSLNVTVINCLGAKVFNGSVVFAGGKAQINVSDAAAGMYLIQLNDARGKSESFKMMIEK